MRSRLMRQGWTTVGLRYLAMLRRADVSTIRIGIDERDLRDADTQWITQEIVGRRQDGQDVCVLVRINEPGANLPLSTPACRVGGGGGGGGRPPNALETAIFDLWEKRGLNSGNVEPGEVIAFVRHVLQLL